MSLKNDITEKKGFFGKDRNIKRIKRGEAKLVYIASDCPDRDEVIRNCKANDVKYIELKENSKEVGIICKKSFNINVVSF